MPDRKSWEIDPNSVDLDVSEVLFEIRAVGNAVKVSAIDPITNTEVSVVGPATASPYTLKMNAVRKLKSVLRKRRTQPPKNSRFV
jgi:ABC-type Zn2+ transport system substrate-binding protein/surface adhesin